MTSLESRFRGALVGLAIGDAVGTTVEFQAPGTFTPVTDMVGGGPFGLKPGQWTDDTSMALCLAQSLIDCRGFDARDQQEKYLRWWREGYMSSTGRCFDIGNTVRGALTRYLQFKEPFAGSTDPHSAGNGSIMRLAPVPLFYFSNPEQAIHLSGESSRTTHQARTAIDACRYLSALIVGALRGSSKEALLSPDYSPAPGLWGSKPLCSEIAEIANGSYRHKTVNQIRGSGYVVQSLEAALWAFATTESFKEGCLAAVNLGEDADTTAAVYGQLAGAYHGLENIPEGWRKKITDLNEIMRMADDLANSAVLGR
ncbi:MAG: ADP-ribosylglycohydrolase family protein [Verrucomicrobia bacterium]|nr:ADP-ribosylglycohydrolase family protein [Verrucomicrobiota bacterium]